MSKVLLPRELPGHILDAASVAWFKESPLYRDKPHTFITCMQSAWSAILDEFEQPGVSAQQSPELAAAEARIKQLEAALEPFAHIAGRFPVNPKALREKRLQEATLWSATDFTENDEGIFYEITVSHCRDAAAALSGVEANTLDAPAQDSQPVAELEGEQEPLCWVARDVESNSVHDAATKTKQEMIDYLNEVDLTGEFLPTPVYLNPLHGSILPTGKSVEQTLSDIAGLMLRLKPCIQMLRNSQNSDDYSDQQTYQYLAELLDEIDVNLTAYHPTHTPRSKS